MTTPPLPETAPKKRTRHLGLKILGSLLLLVVIVLALWTWFALSYRYATGQKTGYVQSLTKNGWLCKTWEGEMTVNPIGSVPSPNFRFTIRSDSLATVVQNLIGKEVTVDYAQHVALPSKCLGDTPFFIEGARASLP
jgi:hypothetical protein